jgi:hypothetical protein
LVAIHEITPTRDERKAAIGITATGHHIYGGRRQAFQRLLDAKVRRQADSNRLLAPESEDLCLLLGDRLDQPDEHCRRAVE